MTPLESVEALNAVVTDGMFFTLGAYKVEIYSPQIINEVYLSFTAIVVVTKDGQKIYEDTASIVNPPVLVPDINGDIIRGAQVTWDPIAQENVVTPVSRFRFDPLTAFKTVISDTILVLET